MYGHPAYIERVGLPKAFAHLLRFADHNGTEGEEGTWNYRFASDPRFCHFAFDMKQRHAYMDIGDVFIRQHPGECPMSWGEVKDLCATGSDSAVLEKLSCWTAGVPNSARYWKKQCASLRAIFAQEGCGTIFWTGSAADNWWPQLHAHLPNRNGGSLTERHADVISNPHLVGSYFVHKTKSFVEHFLKRLLGADWTYHRYEWQCRGRCVLHWCGACLFFLCLGRLFFVP